MLFRNARARNTHVESTLNLSCPAQVQEDELADAFDRLDSDDSGAITKDNLRQLLGNQFSASLVEEMIADADFKQNGTVDYEEFKKMMLGSSGKRMRETKIRAGSMPGEPAK